MDGTKTLYELRLWNLEDQVWWLDLSRWLERLAKITFF